MKFFIILLLFSGLCRAEILLDIVLTHRKGIDNQLVLVNEYHHRRPVFENVEHNLELSKKFSLIYRVDLLTNPGELPGPVGVITLDGTLYSDGKKIIEFRSKDNTINLGEKVSLEYDGIDGQLIQLSLVPNIR